MKSTEQYFPVVLFIMLFKVVLIFKSVSETTMCDYFNESCREILFHHTVLFSVREQMIFKILDVEPGRGSERV